MQSKLFSRNKTLNLKGKLMELSRPRVMGILNVTPDSFFDGGKFTSEIAVLEHVEKMLRDGADFIDIGGYSTRPGADVISPEVELQRVIPIISLVMKKFPETHVSIDTFRSEVARQAVLEGACFVNDVSGGELDAKMFDTVAGLNVPYCLMHMRGTPATMAGLNEYDNMLLEMIAYFQSRIARLRALGVHDVVVDPGFGFAKSGSQNFSLLENLSAFFILDLPILAGLSRKSMVWKTLEVSPEAALNGTTSLHTVALLNGASILRVHDVREAVESIRLMERLRPAST